MLPSADIYVCIWNFSLILSSTKLFSIFKSFCLISKVVPHCFSCISWINVKTEFILLLLLLLFYLLFKYNCLHFHSTTPPCPTHPHLPPSKLPPLVLPMFPSYMFLYGSPSIIPYYPSPSSSLGTVRLFLVQFTQWNITQKKERRNSYLLWQHGWNWGLLC